MEPSILGGAMQDQIIDKLLSSFSELEHAIVSARSALETRDNVPSEVFNRLDSYDGIIEKQRVLAETLCGHMATGDWDQVSRHVSLINGLSTMIRDDARSILTSLTDSPERGSVENSVVT